MITYSNSPETHIDIPLTDGKKISGILRGELSANTPVLIMMHGLPGSKNELLQYLGAHYLSEQGISTLRLSMYDFGKEYRSILDCTLEIHIADFNDVVVYLQKEGAVRIFASGHSYGGITILGSKVKLSGAILWDPSHGLAWQDPIFDSPDFPSKECGDIIIGTGGYGYITSKKLEAYNKLLGDTTDWAKEKNYPMKFIIAGAGPLSKYNKKYFEVADDPKEIIVFEDAHHQFEDSDDVVERLFAETSSFIKKYS